MNDLEAVRYASRMCGYPSTSSECLNRGELDDVGSCQRTPTVSPCLRQRLGGEHRTDADDARGRCSSGGDTDAEVLGVRHDRKRPADDRSVRSQIRYCPSSEKDRMFLMGEVIRHLHERADKQTRMPVDLPERRPTRPVPSGSREDANTNRSPPVEMTRPPRSVR